MLIAMAVWDTEENQRTTLTKATLEGLARTVDWTRHRLIVSDNGSIPATLREYEVFQLWMENAGAGGRFAALLNGENIGTAKAINRAWEYRGETENCVKMDNDVIIHTSGWADQIDDLLQKHKDIGICGLKRRDLAESPWSEGWAKSTIRMLPHAAGERWFTVEEVSHVMGTCQAYSWRLINKIGGLYQMGGLYGFDDSLASLRAHLAGFKTVFLCNIDIEHIDPGTTPYQTWKQNYAGEMMDKFTKVKADLMSGKQSVYYPLSRKV